VEPQRLRGALAGQNTHDRLLGDRVCGGQLRWDNSEIVWQRDRLQFRWQR
jgi:hypothetical protein